MVCAVHSLPQDGGSDGDGVGGCFGEMAVRTSLGLGECVRGGAISRARASQSARAPAADRGEFGLRNCRSTRGNYGQLFGRPFEGFGENAGAWRAAQPAWAPAAEFRGEFAAILVL